MPSAPDVLIPFYRLFKKSDAYPTDPIDGLMGCIGMGFSAVLDFARVALAVKITVDVMSNPSSSDNLPKALLAIGTYTALGYLNSKLGYK